MTITAPKPQSNVEKLAYCLACGGTGRRGNLSGKKKCQKCAGTGRRSVLNEHRGSTMLDAATAPRAQSAP